MSVNQWGELARLADEQWGQFTTAQARQRGVSRAAVKHWSDNGILTRLTTGIYAFPGATDSALAYERALWLSLSPEQTLLERFADLPSAGVFTHTTAARIHDLGNIRDPRAVIALPSPRRIRRPELDIRTADLRHDEVELAHGIPVTTPLRTVRDLLADGHGLHHVAEVLDDAHRTRPLRMTDLARNLDPIAPHLGTLDGAHLVERLTALANVTG